MKRAIVVGTLLVAGCGSPPAKQPANGNQPAAAALERSAPSAGTATPANGIAQYGAGRLSATVSPLSGTVTGFSSQETATGKLVVLDADVLFDFDKAVLRTDAMPALAKTAAAIRAGGTGSIAVSGFTDSKGGDDYNLELSRQRAQAVTNWLLEQPGIKTHDFEVRGRGEASPIVPNTRPDGSDDPAARAKNRRVEVNIH